MWNITEDTMKRKLHNHKNGAKKRGIPCDLTLEELTSLFTINGGFCDYTNKPMKLLSESTSDNELVSLERIDEYGIYSKNNLLLVRRDANCVKSMVLESKSTHESKYKLTHEIKEIINMICEIIYNPVKLKEVQSKYLINNGEIMQNNETEVDALETKPNPEIALALEYGQVGSLLEGAGAVFELTFNQFKLAMARKTCAITGRTFEEGDVKSFYRLSKDLPFRKDNVLLTSVKIQKALDIFLLESSMDMFELKKLGDKLGRK